MRLLPDGQRPPQLLPPPPQEPVITPDYILANTKIAAENGHVFVHADREHVSDHQNKLHLESINAMGLLEHHHIDSVPRKTWFLLTIRDPSTARNIFEHMKVFADIIGVGVHAMDSPVYTVIIRRKNTRNFMPTADIQVESVITPVVGGQRGGESNRCLVDLVKAWWSYNLHLITNFGLMVYTSPNFRVLEREWKDLTIADCLALVGVAKAKKRLAEQSTTPSS